MALRRRSWIVSVAHKKVVHFRDRNARVVALEQLEVILYRDGTFLLDGEVEAAASAGQEAIDHIVALKLGGELVAGHAGLAHHHNR